MTGRSLVLIASMMSLPMPGQANTVSVTTPKASSTPNTMPSTVMSGMEMLWQHVAKQDPRGRKSLGAGVADIVRADVFLHAGARQADDQRHREEATG